MEAEFRSFYKEHQRFVHHIAASQLSSAGDVGEVESLVWYDIYRHFERFQVEDPRGLLRRLIKWRTSNFHRTYQTFRRVDVQEERLYELFHSASTTLDAETRLSLQEALSQEQPQDISILFGRYIEGMTWEELATQHGLHRNTVWKRTRAALKRLRVFLSTHSENQV